VVNEALNPGDGLAGGLRTSPLTSVIGLDWMNFAFKAARAADPGALLVYNDYGMETTGVADSDTKRAALLNMIDQFQKSNIPIDAIGIQSHMFAYRWQYFGANSFALFLSQIAARGLKIFITEMDVIDVGLPTDTGQRDQEIASFYSKFWQAALSQRNVIVAETWGLADPESWQMQEGTNALFYRNDGTPPRPLPFDAQFMPKPNASALANALAGAPAR
jgi:endo-1,4-beta-xylanase